MESVVTVVLSLCVLLLPVVIVPISVVLGLRAARARAEASAPSAPRSTGTAVPLPPIPAPPSPAHRLRPGMYMFGQLWRYDGAAWHAELGDDCEPVVAIFHVGGFGTCAVTWDSVYRRTAPGGAWTREYQSPGGRPRLGAGWGHPKRGLFAAGDRGVLLRSIGDGAWERVPTPIATVISAVWGDDEQLFVGYADGRIASKPWASSGEWTTEETPAQDHVFDGVCTRRGVVAISQSGAVLSRAAPGAPWLVDKQFAGPVRGLLAAPDGRIWVASQDGVWRSDAPGEWVAETTGGMNALASDGATTWAAGAGCVLMRRDAAGEWTPNARGRSGNIRSLWAGPGGELLAGTDFMLEVGENGQGRDVEVVASRNV